MEWMTPKKTRSVQVGKVQIGGGAPVSIQSMTNTDTADVEKTLEQICALADLGADIVRISVYNAACVKAVRSLVEASPVPLVADIHYDARLAVGAVEQGIAKLRINPGNIGGEEQVKRVVDCVKQHHVPIRVGLNSGSVNKVQLLKFGGATPEALLESAQEHIDILEKLHFYDTVLSLKMSDVKETIRVYRLAYQRWDYPLHIGVTEAGGDNMGLLRGAIGIGSLLSDGIGDTVRVSLTGSPLQEIPAAQQILRAVGVSNDYVRIISCPTCGRTCIDVQGIAAEVEKRTRHIHAPLKVAVMGCVVNGPGEARGADVGIAGGHDGGALFCCDRPVRKVAKEKLLDELMKEIDRLLLERKAEI